MRWPFPIASMLRSSAAVVLGWPVYGSGTPKYIDKIHRIFTRLYEAKLWVYYRFHPSHKYHIVKTDLEPGYYDVDTRMLHACMTLLCSYVEDECESAEKLDEWTNELRQEGSEGNGPREVIDRQADRQAEVTAIYKWWKIERPEDQRNYDAMLDQLFGERRRISFKECEDNPQLSEMIVEPFKGDETILHEKFRKLEKKIEDDEQSMLHRLITIRKALWT